MKSVQDREITVLLNLEISTVVDLPCHNIPPLVL